MSEAFSEPSEPSEAFEGSHSPDVWQPWCERPSGLIVPSGIDPHGVDGPTRGKARGRGWEKVAPQLWAPSGRPDVVEQRILEQGTRVHGFGGVTAWAALRWHGARYFDGVANPGRLPLPVPLVIGSQGSLRAHPGSTVSKAQFAPAERREIDGITVASVQRALFDEVVRRGQLYPAVQAIDMTLGARLISASLFAEYVEHRQAWTGVPFVRTALALAHEESRSPKETWLRLIWILVLGWEPPLCNRPVFFLDGTLIGIPDLFDEEAGFAGEYNGGHHEGAAQTKKDKEREAKFRDAGIEYVESVRGDRLGDAAHRLHRARARARFLPPEARAWTLEPPSHWRTPETLDARLTRLGLVDDLRTH